MEKSKAYKEGIAIPAKRVLVKNPKIYGSIAIVFFVLGLVAVFLPIFQTRIPDAKVPENPDLFFKTYGAMQGGHWFPVFCVILSAVLSCACIALAFLGTRKEGKTMKAVVLIGLANVILLLFALLFMNTTMADYDAGKGVIAQTTNTSELSDDRDQSDRSCPLRRLSARLGRSIQRLQLQRLRNDDVCRL